MPIIKTIDLHQLTLIEAKDELDRFMDRLTKDVEQVVVIHGYRHGQRLKRFVTNYEHPKIIKKLKTLNQGETIFRIK